MTQNTEQFVMVDDNVGLTNRIEKGNIDTVVSDTFKDIAGVLAGHCGPYGKFAMLARAGAQVAEPVFTKDGIGIVRAMQYASPAQEFIRNTMAYMGSRIETAAGDGTTSSMILLAKGIAKLRTKLMDLRHRYTFAELQSAYNEFAAEVSSIIEQDSVKISKYNRDADTTTFVRNVAYSQAWTSTHGNTELSSAIADLFANNPKEAWEYLAIEKSRIENDKPYFIEVDNSQYSIQDITIWPESAKSEDLGLTRRRENARTILSALPPDNGNYDGMLLLGVIKDAVESKEQLTVICPKSIASGVQMELTDLFNKNPDHDVCIFFIKDDDPRLNDITCMKALAGKLDCMIELNLSYKYEKGDLTILSGLYDLGENDVVNPHLGDPAYPDLNELVANIDKVLNQIRNEVSNRRLNEETKRLKKLRLKMTVARRSYFKIGGSAYDNATAVDVVLDAILATKHTLEKGFGYGGNRMLYNALKKYDLALLAKEHTYSNDLKHVISYIFMDNIKELHADMLSHVLVDKGEYVSIPEEYFEYSVDLTALDQTDTLESNISRFGVKLNMLQSLDIKTTPVILQPIATDIEFVKRFGELALKFIYTNRIIVDGGMCRNEKK